MVCPIPQLKIFPKFDSEILEFQLQDYIMKKFIKKNKTKYIKYMLNKFNSKILKIKNISKVLEQDDYLKEHLEQNLCCMNQQEIEKEYKHLKKNFYEMKYYIKEFIIDNI
jgi:hypothetical protein